MSNNHILANLNQAKIGDSVLQPGPADGGKNPADLIARLHRFVPLKPSGSTVDAAIAKLDPAISLDPKIYSIGVPVGIGQPILGMTVRKQGRTSGLTTGTIDDPTYDTTIPADIDGASIITLHQQIRIVVGAADRFIALPGDSGSLFVDPLNQAIGMLAACTDDGGFAYASRFSDIQEQLKIELVT